jgi:hypothetical protein
VKDKIVSLPGHGKQVYPEGFAQVESRGEVRRDDYYCSGHAKVASTLQCMDHVWMIFEQKRMTRGTAVSILSWHLDT